MDPLRIILAGFILAIAFIVVAWIYEALRSGRGGR